MVFQYLGLIRFTGQSQEPRTKNKEPQPTHHQPLTTSYKPTTNQATMQPSNQATKQPSNQATITKDPETQEPRTEAPMARRDVRSTWIMFLTFNKKHVRKGQRQQEQSEAFPAFER